MPSAESQSRISTVPPAPPSSPSVPPPPASSPRLRPPRKKRGFELLSPEEKKRVSSRGGRAAHAVGTAHQFTKEEARIAGRKGGLAMKRKSEPFKG
jgi:hypothetical protein